MKKSVFLSIGIVMFALASCLKEEPTVVNYYDMPAIVTLDYATFHLMIQTPIGTFYPSGLSEEYTDGDILWINFTYDEGNQPYSDVTTASGIQVLAKMNPKYVQEAGETLTDDFTTPIADLYTQYTSRINDYLFVVIQHEAKDEQTFDYEMRYTMEDGATIPTLFLKAKATGEGTGSKMDVATPLACNISAFISKYRTENQTSVDFIIKVYQGIDAEGNDVYTALPNTPITWGVGETTTGQ